MSDNVKLISGEANGAGAVGHILDTAVALSTSGAVLLQIKNLGIVKFSIDKDGVPICPGILTSGTIKSNGDLVFQVDADNNGTNSYSFLNGSGTEIANLDESGNLQLDGNVTSSGKIIATDTISYKRKAIFKTYSDFSTAAFTNTITLFALPATAIIKDIYAWCSAPFKHGTVTENFTTNGGSDGKFQVADPTGFSTGNYVAIIDDDTSIVYGYIVAITDLGGGAWEIHIQDAPSAGVDVDLSNFTTSQNAKVYFNLTAYTFEIGITGTTNKYIASGRDIFTGALEFKAATDKGTALTTLGQTNLENMSVSTNIVCKVDSTNALLNQLSQGQLRIWIEYSDVE